MMMTVRMSDDQFLPSRLPSKRQDRAWLALFDSSEFISRMGSEDVDRLLMSLSKTDGLSQSDLDVLKQERYNVPLEFLPDYLREDHR